MRISFLKPLAIVAAVLVAPATGRADWMTEFSGNSQVNAPQQAADGVINFAVYKNTTGDWLSALGVTATQLGAPGDPSVKGAIDTKATYVYMYQIVNTKITDSDVPANALVALNVAVDKANVTGYGSLNGKVFKESDGALVGGGTNTRLDYAGGDSLAKNASPVEGFPINGVPGFKFLASDTGVVGIGSDSAAMNATNAGFSNLPVNPPPSYAPYLRFDFGTMPLNAYTSIVFITSNVNPNFYAGLTQQGTEFAAGDVATMNQAPEPGTMALLALGLPLAGYRYRRRLQKRAAAAAAAN